LVLTT